MEEHQEHSTQYEFVYGCMRRINMVKELFKTLLVDIKVPNLSDKKLRAYCILDEQSNSSFAHPKVLEFFNITAPREQYDLTTMSGSKTSIHGFKLTGIVIKGVDERTTFNLPPLLTNEFIPDTRSEVASPDIVEAHGHIAHLAPKFQRKDVQAEVLLLIGRNCGDLMSTVCHGRRAPFAHRTPLGWALVGPVCPEAHLNETRNATVLRTDCLHNHFSTKTRFLHKSTQQSVFEERYDDELPGMSRDDVLFLDKIEKEISINDKGNMEMPLPFRKEKPQLANNRDAVYSRTRNTLNRLKREPIKLQQSLQAMEKNIVARHVEKIPASELETAPDKSWFIPVFPVTHPKKGKIRLVFDSSASYQGTSLNKELLAGPDQLNKLKGVLLRFREGEIGYVADIEAMFHAFHVAPSDRDFLRFFWFDSNDPNNQLVQYRATVHVFGNSSSPAIANFGLRHAALQNNENSYTDAKEFILNNFYVDDGLGSADSTSQAVQTLQGAIDILRPYNIRLHKICSPSRDVMAAFPPSERAEDVEVVHLEEKSTHRTLGVAWDLASDQLFIKTSAEERPFTKRGVLSVIGSIFDPLGLASPVVLEGKLIQRSILPAKGKASPDLEKCGWDDPLPERYLPLWESWKKSINSAPKISIPRGYQKGGFGEVICRELHVFSDASLDAIGYVMYLKSENVRGDIQTCFVTGSSKVAPRSATTIPRLELCATVEAVSAAMEVLDELRFKPDQVSYYTDSTVTLGYINNETKRFSRYVTRRVDLIRKFSDPKQWKYVSTDKNPADIASRPHRVSALADTIWIQGPKFLRQCEEFSEPTPDWLEEVLPEEVAEKELASLRTSVTHHQSCYKTLLQRKNGWKFVKRVVQRVHLVHCALDRARQRLGFHLAPRGSLSDQEAERELIKDAQLEHFPELFQHLNTQQLAKPLPNKHKLASLSPFIDEHGLARVGGRLKNANVPFDVKHPVILPAKHKVSSMILQHHHAKTKHQGRHITLGAVRSAGFHLQSGKKMVNEMITNCITCRKLRAPLHTQRLADLPSDRLEEISPFSNSGMDVFGPFLISEGVNTRRNKALKKVWVLLFTCLVSRAVHTEVLPSMDTSSMKNALRRFFAIRGPCKILRSDRGSNFIGVKNQEEQTALSQDDIQAAIEGEDCIWMLNPPGASHFGGVWERKIGSMRRVLEAALLQLGPRRLNQDEFATIIAEATNIVNNTPLWEVSHKPDDPCPLSPNMLLTMKECSNPPKEVFSTQDLLAYGKRRWRRVQYLADQFWTRWRTQFLSNFHHRTKNLREKDPLKIGDLVLIKEKSEKRNKWPMAIIQETTRSHDGRVRSAYVRTKSSNKILLRPVHNLVKLLSSAES